MKYSKLVEVYEELEKTPAKLKKRDIIAELLKEKEEPLKGTYRAQAYIANSPNIAQATSNNVYIIILVTCCYIAGFTSSIL